jgi:hypothetical protein
MDSIATRLFVAARPSQASRSSGRIHKYELLHKDHEVFCSKRKYSFKKSVNSNKTCRFRLSSLFIQTTTREMPFPLFFSKKSKTTQTPATCPQSTLTASPKPKPNSKSIFSRDLPTFSWDESKSLARHSKYGMSCDIAYLGWDRNGSIDEMEQKVAALRWNLRGLTEEYQVLVGSLLDEMETMLECVRKLLVSYRSFEQQAKARFLL